MSREKIGFIYLWMNKTNGKYYVGSHKGDPSDGYICSSKSMLISYHRNPEKFKRKILEMVDGNLSDLHERESYWLSLIRDHELGRKYYNQKKIAKGGNGSANKGKSKPPDSSWNRGKTKEYMKEYSRVRSQGLFCLLSEKPIEKEKRLSGFEKVCQNCSENFLAKYRLRSFCSKSCAAVSQHKNNPRKPITKNNSIKKEQPKIDKLCPNCNSPFTTRSKNGRTFCSRSCSASNNAKKVVNNGMKTPEAKEKMKIIASSRKRIYHPDGSWYWGRKDAGNSVSKEPAASFT